MTAAELCAVDVAYNRSIAKFRSVTDAADVARAVAEYIAAEKRTIEADEARRLSATCYELDFCGGRVW